MVDIVMNTSTSPMTSMAISCMWSWMIPHFYIEFTEYRLALVERRKARRAVSVDDDDDDDDEDATHNKATVRGVCAAVLIIIIVYISSFVIMGKLTRQKYFTMTNTDDEDEDTDGIPMVSTPPTFTKSDAIVIGIGRMLSACLLAYFSIEIPKWLGVTYSSQKHVKYYKNYKIASIVGSKELSFRVCWSLLGHFFIMYPFLLMYFCNVTPGTVTLSTFIGIVFGFAVVYFVWLSHTHLQYQQRSLVALLLSTLLALSSSAAFSAGCWYVKEVWHNNQAYTNEYTILTFFAWTVLEFITHIIYYRLTQRKIIEQTLTTTTSTVATSAVGVVGADVAATVASTIDIDVDVAGGANNNGGCMGLSEEVQKVKGEWRYGQSQIFQPPKGIHSVAAELSQVMTGMGMGVTLVSPKVAMQRFVTAMSPSSFRRKRNSNTEDNDNDNDINNSISPENGYTDNTNDNDDDGVSPTRLNFGDTDTDTDTHNHTTMSLQLPTEDDAIDRDHGDPQTIATATSPNRARIDTAATFRTVDSDTMGSISSNNSDNEEDDDVDGDIDGIDVDIDIEDAIDYEGKPAAATMTPTTTTTTGIINNGANTALVVDDCLEDNEREKCDDDDCDDTTNPPTLWYMIKANSCCRRRQHYNAPKRKGWDRCCSVFKWTLWAVTAGMHVIFTIATIGATLQQNAARAALDTTFQLLYPPNYVTTGPMCAWNYTTKSSSSLLASYPVAVDHADTNTDMEIRTFQSLEDVHEAHYSVIHCGECGHCSNWNDLRLQWTTRTYLAESAKECTKEILFGGTVDDVQECNEEIGFTEDCAMCWTVDEMCAKDRCFFIFLQSVFTNSVSQFSVNENGNDITSAACDEALCGPEFVPCSGATRRRMNIVSDISRPATQQCTVVTEDWSVVFDHE